MKKEKTMEKIATHRKAYHNYEILEKLEAGIELKGSEVKSLRNKSMALGDAYAQVIKGELWMKEMGIPLWEKASYLNHEERRPRKLLMHKNQILRLEKATEQKGYTLVPLELYFDKNGRIKVLLGLGKGKNTYDKRQSEKISDMKKEVDRIIKIKNKS